MFLIKKLQNKFKHEKQYSQPGTKLKNYFLPIVKTHPREREEERGKKPTTNPQPCGDPMADLKPVTKISFAEIFLCRAFMDCFAEVPLIFLILT